MADINEHTDIIESNDAPHGYPWNGWPCRVGRVSQGDPGAHDDLIDLDITDEDAVVYYAQWRENQGFEALDSNATADEHRASFEALSGL